jgi:hypothetical protein
MVRTKDSLDVGFEQVKRLVDGQFSSLASIQAKIGVLLGFDVTALGLIFTFGNGWILANRPLGALCAAILMGSLVVFASALMLQSYEDAPDPYWLVNSLNDPDIGALTLRTKLIGMYSWVYLRNKRTLSRRFYLVNAAVTMMVVGISVFALGVLLS